MVSMSRGLVGVWLSGLLAAGCGADADMGAQGAMGAPGPEGPAGPAGPTTGSSGTGAPGVPGAMGFTGAVGDPGATGREGAQGPAGPPGQTGERGLNGAMGNSGPMGPPGANGNQGPAGVNGIAGLPGPEGPFGIVGEDLELTSLRGLPRTGTNITGVDLLVGAGLGTGTGPSGNLRLQAAAGGAGGGLLNPPVDRLIVVGKPKLMSNAATAIIPLFSVGLTGSQVAGGRVRYVVRAIGGSETVTEAGTIRWLATATGLTCFVVPLPDTLRRVTNASTISSTCLGQNYGAGHPGLEFRSTVVLNDGDGGLPLISLREVTLEIENTSGAQVDLNPGL
jgi:hypothetical protein